MIDAIDNEWDLKLKLKAGGRARKWCGGGNLEIGLAGATVDRWPAFAIVGIAFLALQ